MTSCQVSESEPIGKEVIPKSVMNKSSTFSSCSSDVGPGDGAMVGNSVTVAFVGAMLGARVGDAEGKTDDVPFNVGEGVATNAEGLVEGASVAFSVGAGVNTVMPVVGTAVGCVGDGEGIAVELKSLVSANEGALVGIIV